MIPFFSVAGGSIILAYLSSTFFKWRSPSLFLRFLDPFSVALSCILIFFAGTRYGLGTDYNTYVRIYEKLDPTDWVNSLEKPVQEQGFTLLSLAFKTLEFNASEFMFTISAFTVALVLLAIHFSKVNLSVAISAYMLFGYYLSPMNIVRQGLACAMLLLAVVVFNQNKYFRTLAVFLVICAPFIHTSALFAICAFMFVKFCKITNTRLILITIAGLILGVVFSRFPFLLNLVGTLNERYAEYASVKGSLGLGTLLVAILHVSIGFYLLKLNNWTSNEKWYLNIYLLTGALYLLGAGIDWAARLGEYTSIFLILLLPKLFLSRGTQRWIGFVILVIGIGYFFMNLKFWGGLIPYASWLNF